MNATAIARTFLRLQPFRPTPSMVSAFGGPDLYEFTGASMLCNHAAYLNAARSQDATTRILKRAVAG